jgi:hypothetical protein
MRASLAEISAGRASRPALAWWARSPISFSSSWSRSRAAMPATASRRRTPEATAPSEMILMAPIWPVLATWVPPHSSVEKSGMLMTRTVSPYFSPKRAMAPEAKASSMGISRKSVSWALRTCSLALRSISTICSGSMGAKWLKSKRRRWSSTTLPACLT